MKRRFAVLAAAVTMAAGQLLTAGMAQAAQPSLVWIDGAGVLRFDAADPHTNTVTVSVSGANYRVVDTTWPIAVALPCVAVANGADCPIASVTGGLRVALGDLNDTAQNQTLLAGQLLGEAGNDQLIGGSAGETLSGGNDNDVIDGGRGSDLILGDAGFDWAMYTSRVSPVTVTLNGAPGDGEAPEGDNVIVEHVQGGAGGDLIVGNALPNVLVGNGGVDHVFGEGANDNVIGGTGDDYLGGGPGPDVIDGGPNVDQGDGDWNQNGADDDAAADVCSGATEVQFAC